MTTIGADIDVVKIHTQRSINILSLLSGEGGNPFLIKKLQQFTLFMQIFNQAFYFFFALIIFIIFLGQLRFDGARLVKFDDSAFWQLALLLQAAACLAFFFSSFGYKFFLPIGNIGLVCSGLAVTLLIYGWVHPGSKNITRFPWAILAVFVIFEFLGATAALSIRVLVLSLVSCLIYIYALALLGGMKSDQGNEIHFTILRLVLVVKICILLIRSYFVLYSDTPSSSIYLEQGTTALVRILGVTSNLLVYVAILNILYQKVTFKAERKARVIEGQMLGSLNALAMARDNETGNHIIRTQNYVKKLALRLRMMGHYKDELSDEVISLLFKAAPLHDIGKVGIPDHILHKPGRLDEKEWQVMKTHATIGEAVLSSAEYQNQDDGGLIKEAIKIAGGHHEEWDGSGYPRGLKGDQIPPPARIMALADVYDALVSERIYKTGWSHEDAVNEITSKRGTHFDPLVVDAFISEQDGFLAIYHQYEDS